MRASQLVVSVFLATSLFAASAMAADAAPSTGQAKSSDKLEKISDAPAASKTDIKDCPMHHGKKECDHKKGEPCPYHQDKKHHGKSHDKCDHEHRS